MPNRGETLDRLSRLVIAALLSGVLAGAVAGVGARLVMYGIRLANPAFSGSTTHAGFENGHWTLAGTMSVVVTGMFFGAPAGVLYLPVRRFLGSRTAIRGVVAGLLLLAAFGPVVLDGSYEFSRFVSASVSVSAFAALFLLFGVALATAADAIAPPRPMRRPAWRPVGAVALGILGLVAAWQLVGTLRFRYGF